MAARPYDLRHTGVSLWLDAGGLPGRWPSGRTTVWRSRSACTPSASGAMAAPHGSESRLLSLKSPRWLAGMTDVTRVMCSGIVLGVWRSEGFCGGACRLARLGLRAGGCVAMLRAPRLGRPCTGLGSLLARDPTWYALLGIVNHLASAPSGLHARPSNKDIRSQRHES